MTNELMLAEYASDLRVAAGDQIAAVIRRQYARIAELERQVDAYKSLQESMDARMAAQSERLEKGKEAVATLQSERAANTILTARVEKLEAHATDSKGSDWGVSRQHPSLMKSDENNAASIIEDAACELSKGYAVNFRDVAERVLASSKTRIAELEAQLEAVGAEGVGAMLPRHAQPAPAVVDQTPVAVVDEDEDGLFADFETESGVLVKRGDKLYAAPPPPQIAEPAGNATPSVKGIYAWVPENGPPALLHVNKRPSSHSPGGVLNAHVLQSPSFYDGCAVSQWGPGCWILLRNLEIKKEPS